LRSILAAQSHFSFIEVPRFLRHLHRQRAPPWPWLLDQPSKRSHIRPQEVGADHQCCVDESFKLVLSVVQPKCFFIYSAVAWIVEEQSTWHINSQAIDRRSTAHSAFSGGSALILRFLALFVALVPFARALSGFSAWSPSVALPSVLSSVAFVREAACFAFKRRRRIWLLLTSEFANPRIWDSLHSSCGSVHAAFHANLDKVRLAVHAAQAAQEKLLAGDRHADVAELSLLNDVLTDVLNADAILWSR
jgi:hypothetical protein